MAAVCQSFEQAKLSRGSCMFPSCNNKWTALAQQPLPPLPSSPLSQPISLLLSLSSHPSHSFPISLSLSQLKLARTITPYLSLPLSLPAEACSYYHSPSRKYDTTSREPHGSSACTEPVRRCSVTEHMPSLSPSLSYQQLAACRVMTGEERRDYLSLT